MSELISISEAAKLGINRLRLSKWATPEDHIKIDIINGKPGPWVHLYAPFNLECNGQDPVSVLSLGYDIFTAYWLPYDGPISGSKEYVAAQSRYAGVLGRN